MQLELNFDHLNIKYQKCEKLPAHDKYYCLIETRKNDYLCSVGLRQDNKKNKKQQDSYMTFRVTDGCLNTGSLVVRSTYEYTKHFVKFVRLFPKYPIILMVGHGSICFWNFLTEREMCSTLILDHPEHSWYPLLVKRRSLTDHAFNLFWHRFDRVQVSTTNKVF